MHLNWVYANFAALLIHVLRAYDAPDTSKTSQGKHSGHPDKGEPMGPD